MTIIIILILCGLVILSVAIHLSLLRCLIYLIRRMQSFPILGMGISMFAAISGHLFEIWIFSLAIMLMCSDVRFGSFAGDDQLTKGDYFYYSALSYTSLGFGDVSPEGALRTLSAVEAITGLVLIAWTASFAFLVMQELWGNKSR
ncbi:ion channel [Bythopirellula goksoeyrii]|uniref:Ion channel n=1 Tax=Bythopirellula goksoeyrii TaxID=1400387 RepID=A0A5B9QFB4_9BACT|nr:ion channel [Bythopirellula goksoeyrii]QEG36350.1 Ion channel [Bythopirellula goksoeyrii]